MRVRATVIGNTLVVDEAVQLPEGVELDDETATELQLALKEADAGDFVSEEDVWAEIEARYGCQSSARCEGRC